MAFASPPLGNRPSAPVAPWWAFLCPDCDWIALSASSLASMECWAVGVIAQRAKLIVQWCGDSGEPDAAAELAGEAVLRLWSDKARYDASRAMPIAFLTGLLRNLHLERLRDQRKRRDRSRLERIRSYQSDREDLVPAEACCGRDMLAALQAAVQELDGADRELLRLRFGYPDGVPLRSGLRVQNDQLHRVLLRLRERLQDYR